MTIETIIKGERNILPQGKNKVGERSAVIAYSESDGKNKLAIDPSAKLIDYSGATCKVDEDISCCERFKIKKFTAGEVRVTLENLQVVVFRAVDRRGRHIPKGEGLFDKIRRKLNIVNNISK